MDECPLLRGYSEESIKSKVKPSAINLDGFTGKYDKLLRGMPDSKWHPLI